MVSVQGVKAMEHRHIDMEPGEWSVAAVESVWERGSDHDVAALLAECRDNPSGPAARAVRKAIPHSTVYGFPTLFRLVLERLDAKRT
jgi:hypothetical protein